MAARQEFLPDQVELITMALKVWLAMPKSDDPRTGGACAYTEKKILQLLENIQGWEELLKRDAEENAKRRRATR